MNDIYIFKNGENVPALLSSTLCPKKIGIFGVGR